MNIIEEAILYGTIMHQGKVRKINNIPYIFHPLEVAQIISTMTSESEVIAAGILHDVVEDTDGSIKEIELRFGKRVAQLVMSETENKYHGQDKSATWERRKLETLDILNTSEDIGIHIMWLADKLSNIRSLRRGFEEKGDTIWESFNQKDPAMHCWYYATVAKYIKDSLGATEAYKEYVGHINHLWPGTV